MSVSPTDPSEAGESPLTEEEGRLVVEKMKALDSLLEAEKALAKYKLEVLFDEERSFHRPFGGLVTWWESGNKLHGGGDSKMYLCPGQDRRKNGCESLIPDSATGANFVVCPSCGQLWRGEEIFGEVYYRLPVDKWADVLLKWFLELDMNADIRLKYAREDIRKLSSLEQEKQYGGELLGRLRSSVQRSTATYPLNRIILDVSAGADLRGRILAFLKA